MKTLFLISLSFITSFLYGQDTREIRVQKCSHCNIEIFHVLKSDKKINHGAYAKVSINDKVLATGYYKNGFKDSTWIQFDNQGKNIVNKGEYFQDKRVGVWEFYNQKGELEQKYDYTKDEISFFLIDDQYTKQNCIVINGNNRQEMKLDRPPLYVGGTSVISQHIASNINYPVDAIDNGISGIVYIALTVDSAGSTRNHRIQKGIPLGCSEEALRVVKLLPDNWFSGILNGEFVTTEIIIPITFTTR